MLARAKAAGKAYAVDQIEGEVFRDYIADMIYRAAQDDLPTKKQTPRLARDVLAYLKQDMSRNISNRDMGLEHIAGSDYNSDGYMQRVYGIDEQELADAWWDGVHGFLGRKTVQAWVADELFFLSQARRE